jgi:hypothetical protein
MERGVIKHEEEGGQDTFIYGEKKAENKKRKLSIFACFSDRSRETARLNMMLGDVRRTKLYPIQPF